MILSFILPMYKVADYVEKCVRSIEDQNIERSEYEIICVNDGSPDNAAEIVTGLQKEYENIILISQENKGVSVARNVGIERAQGKYVVFIDPDDYVVKDSLLPLITYIEAYNPDVAFCGFNFYYADGSIRSGITYEDLKNKTFGGIEAYYLSRRERRVDPDRMWATVYSLDFLRSRNLYFLPDVPYLEDGELITRILCLAKVVIFDDKIFYGRTTRKGSATNSRLFISDKVLNGFFLALKNLMSFKGNENLDEKQLLFLDQPIAKFALLPLISRSRLFTLKQYRSTRKILESILKGKLNTEGCDVVYSQFARFYNKSFYRFYFFWITRGVLIRSYNLFRFREFFLFDWLFKLFNLYNRYIIRRSRDSFED